MRYYIIMERPLSFRVSTKLLENLKNEHREFCKNAGFKFSFKKFLTYKVVKPLNPQFFSSILPKLEGVKKTYLFYVPQNVYENLCTEVLNIKSQTGFPFTVSTLVNYKLSIPLLKEELPQLFNKINQL